MTQQSLFAFYDQKESQKLTRDCALVSKYIQANPGNTIKDYCRDKGKTPNQCSGRFSDLFHNGYLYIDGRKERHSKYYYEFDPVIRMEKKKENESSDLEKLIGKIKSKIKKHPKWKTQISTAIASI